MGELIYLKDVVTLTLDEDRCTGCGFCLLVCPHAVLRMNDRHVQIENKDACMECGACAMNCSTGALSVDAGVGCAAGIGTFIKGCEISVGRINNEILNGDVQNF